MPATVHHVYQRNPRMRSFWQLKAPARA
jgi:hypothetical protein